MREYSEDPEGYEAYAAWAKANANDPRVRRRRIDPEPRFVSSKDRDIDRGGYMVYSSWATRNPDIAREQHGRSHHRPGDMPNARGYIPYYGAKRNPNYREESSEESDDAAKKPPDPVTPQKSKVKHKRAKRANPPDKSAPPKKEEANDPPDDDPSESSSDDSVPDFTEGSNSDSSSSSSSSEDESDSEESSGSGSDSDETTCSSSSSGSRGHSGHKKKKKLTKRMIKKLLAQVMSGKKEKRSRKRGRKYGHVTKENRRRSMAAAPDRYREPVHAPVAPAAVLYSADDLAKVKAPYLSNGSRRDKEKFRNAYIKYGIAHEAVMLQRPPGQRVAPKAVIECIKPSLLMYICKYELKKKYRCDDPALVKAVAVHDWVMKKAKLPLDTEDPDGIAKLRAIKIVINGIWQN